MQRPHKVTSGSSRHVQLQGMPNVRDFGGLTTLDGRRVKRGVLFRASMPEDGCEYDNDRQWVKEQRTILDLRDDKDRANIVTADSDVVDEKTPVAGLTVESVSALYENFHHARINSRGLITTAAASRSRNPCSRSNKRQLHAQQQQQATEELVSALRHLVARSSHEDEVTAIDVQLRIFAPVVPKRALGRFFISNASWSTWMQCLAHACCCPTRLLKNVVAPVVGHIGLEGLYAAILDESRETLMTVLKVLATPAFHPVVIHCSSGKDRTGLVSMLVLRLLGVSEADVLRDYNATEYNPHSVLAYRLASRTGMTGHFDAHWGKAPTYIMKWTLKYLDQKYGGVASYARANGFGDAWQEKLRDSLLEKL